MGNWLLFIGIPGLLCMGRAMVDKWWRFAQTRKTKRWLFVKIIAYLI